MKRSLVLVVWIMLFSYLCSYVLASMKNASSLNSFVYDYGIKNMPRRFRTGKLYDVDLPVNFSGVEVSIIRLRTSRLWRNGLNYSSFEIPSEMLPMPFTRRVDVVYQSLGNWSNAYYRLPGYSFVSPVVGFLTYDSYTNSANHGLVELKARGYNPIIVRFSDVGVAQDEDGSLKCVRFMTNGSWELSNLTSKSTCVATGQGHFSVVRFTTGDGRKPFWKWRVVAIAAGVVVLILMVVIAALVVKCLKRRKVRQMERESERSVILDTIWIRNSKLPFASGIRTEPGIEDHDMDIESSSNIISISKAVLQVSMMNLVF